MRPSGPTTARTTGRRSCGWSRPSARLRFPSGTPTLAVSSRALADQLPYQQAAVRKALDPANLRPRILLADAVGLGKTLEIGMILSELVRRGCGERILIVSPRHVLEQMQNEMWSRFALPFVRLDSAGIQRVRQKIPATRNPFTYYRRVIISIDTLKSDSYRAALAKQRWDAVVIDESHNLSNSATQNNKLARLLARTSDALILASATPHNGKKESFAELIRLLDPPRSRPDGSIVESELPRLVIRRHRHSPEVAQVVGSDWAERQEPHNVLVPASPAENAVAAELEDVWLFPASGKRPNSGQNAALFPWTLAKAFLSSPAALKKTIEERRARLCRRSREERDDREQSPQVKRAPTTEDDLRTQPWRDWPTQRRIARDTVGEVPASADPPSGGRGGGRFVRACRGLRRAHSDPRMARREGGRRTSDSTSKRSRSCTASCRTWINSASSTTSSSPTPRSGCC